MERPIVHADGPLKWAAHVGLDIYYPVPNTGMTRPFLLLVCLLSQFSLTAKMSNHRPGNVVGVIFKKVGRVEAAIQARTVLVQRDAQRASELGLSRPFHAHSMTDFKMVGGVITFLRNQTFREEKWATCFRIVGITRHHLIVEKDTRLLRHPKHLALLKGDSLINILEESEDPELQTMLHVMHSQYWMDYSALYVKHFRRTLDTSAR